MRLAFLLSALMVLPVAARAGDAAIEDEYRNLIALIASGRYREAAKHISPDGLMDGDLILKKEDVVGELLNPTSSLRKRLEQPLSEANKFMCMENGIAFLNPRAFIELTKGRYQVHIQYEEGNPDFFLVSAHSELRIGEVQCSLTLFPHSFKKRNSGIFLADYFRF